MKKTFLLMALALLSANFVKAQAFPKGSMNICVGYGYNIFVGTFFKAWESETGYKLSSLGPAHLKFEYMVGNRVGLGISANYISYKLGYDITYGTNNASKGTESLTYSSISGLVRANFYYVNTEKIGVYSGLGLGYRTGSWTFKSDDPYSGTQTYPSYFPLGMEITTGIKWMFAKNFGAYAELGMAKSFIQAGFCFNFGGSGEGGGGGSRY